ncbi:MAG: ABC transporter ATP-binding protein [Bradymonadaceae bacterium]
MSDDPLLRVDDLEKHFPVYEGVLFREEVERVRAVDGVSFEIEEQETLGLVGESGCGKSTTGRAIIQLHRPTDGSVYYDGTDLATLSDSELEGYRQNLQMIFQDPYASLNPRMTVGSIIGEPLDVHDIASGEERKRRVQELMDVVGLDPRYIRRYPHAFSGGQRQRIGVARALACDPDFIVCDEPVSALDVSIQAQILNLLERLQDEFGLTYLFIAHDLSVVRHISDRIAVMYLGNLVEVADSTDIYDNPKHPYTEALTSAVPVPDPDVESDRERIVLEGDVPSPTDPPSGCVFHTRCPYAWERCEKETPELREIDDGHEVACHLLDEPERREKVDPTERGGSAGEPQKGEGRREEGEGGRSAQSTD